MCVCLYETQREGRNCDDSACSFPLTSTCKRRSRLRRTSLCLSFSLRSLQLPMLHKPASSCSARLRRTLDLIKSKTLYSTCLSQQTHRAALADFFQLLHQPNLSLSLFHTHTLSLSISVLILRGRGRSFKKTLWGWMVVFFPSLFTLCSPTQF